MFILIEGKCISAYPEYQVSLLLGISLYYVKHVTDVNVLLFSFNKTLFSISTEILFYTLNNTNVKGHSNTTNCFVERLTVVAKCPQRHTTLYMSLKCVFYDKHLYSLLKFIQSVSKTSLQFILNKQQKPITLYIHYFSAVYVRWK